MGNSQASGRGNAAEARDEPLEAYLREKQRNDHLKNLGFKRQTSFRKSIAKKLKRHSKHKPPSQTNSDNNSTALEVVDSGPNNHCDVHEVPFRRPSYTSSNHTRSSSNPNLASSSKAEDSDKHTKRGMDNLRKSLRASFRKKKNKDGGGTGDFVKDRTGGSGKSKIFQQDEIAVRAGTCSFDVKYLGCIEVFESRGMTVCEEALKKLKSSKKKALRAILYVNGDGLRVVDYDTKGLLVDQTIEKVSFCAPDHNYDKGFSYICRDGTTRRWMCHGFMAVKETGDRLSHAVGCAFAICLEKKQKRDQECAVTMSFDNSNSSFTRIGSFRQATITERLADPQGIKPSLEPPPKPSQDDQSENPFAIARPRATDLMLQRQTSFREFSRLQSRTSPFKRQLSLRVSELPSSLERKSHDATEFGSINKVAVQSQPDPFGELCEQFKNEAFFCQPTSFNNSSSLFTKAELTTVPEDDDAVCLSPSPLPPLRPTSKTWASEESSLSEGPVSMDAFKMPSFPLEGDNPWDLVPDQPAKTIETNGNKSPSLDLVMEASGNNNESGKRLSNGGTNLMDDPFDADWVSVALKQTQRQFV